MRVPGGKLLCIKDVIRDLQQRSDGTSHDETIDALRAIRGNEPCEKETQLELEVESAVAVRSAVMTAHVPQDLRQKGRGGVGGDAQGCGAREAGFGGRATRRWGVILAGGDGIRLRGLTRFICGDDRPKQFCPLLGKRTLLQEARQRAERSIYPDQLFYSVTRAQREHYIRDLADRPSQRIVQPCNKGTAPAILYTLLHLSQMDPDAIVAILPCDHYYSQESVFTAALESAFAIAEARPTSVALLGAQPKAPEVEYGWIEVGEAVVGPHSGAFHVRGFQEKPSLAKAEHLLRGGSLWNTFVMVGHVDAFLDMAEASVRGLLQTLRSALLPVSGAEVDIADWLYDQLAPTDFSRQVLSPGARRLVTVRLGDVDWNDLGDPDRVLSTLLERDVQLPVWATRWRAEKEAELGATHRVSVAVA